MFEKSVSSILRGAGWAGVLRRNAAIRPERPALLDAAGAMSHADFLRRALGAAATLREMGLSPGARISVISENRREIHLLLGACALGGWALAPVNWRLGPEETTDILRGCAPELLLHGAPLPEGVGLPPSLKAVRAFEGPEAFPFEMIAPESAAALALEPSGPDDPLCLIHTAAVEGKPRGATLSGANLVAAGAQLAHAAALGETDVFLGALPNFHIVGVGFAAAVQLVGGATLVQPRFEAKAAAAGIAEHKVTLAGSFPPILEQILDAADETGADLSSLRAVVGLEGPPMIERLHRSWPGAKFLLGFGQTETSGYVTYGRGDLFAGTAGVPGILTELALADETGAPLAATTPETVGEILVRGPVAMLGYWDQEEVNRETFRHGWLHTGDLGRIDARGRLVYAGRAPTKLLIKTGGENVYPAEVEKALLAHPDLAEAVVVGLPDARWGEAVAALCARKPGAEVSAADLGAFLAGRIARFKQPRHVVFVEALPRGADGKPDRAAALKLVGEAL
ncbi:AMP-binding protein [Neomegalonema sp.]|uniref:AMP-binding protein n=1 Tax=Neomegalonema sp. TaxID=2039713 RepID=UPI00262B6B30|nr:AMP-binding protein [Neomegalonema sp.]MDD2869932.1 AMP-binding protein [Neomegalonema sp.]